MNKVMKGFLVALTIGSSSVAASECSTNECGSGSIGISDTDSNAIYNDQNLSPVVQQANSAVYNQISGNSISSINGISCANDTLAITAGGNQTRYQNNRYSGATNLTAGIMYSMAVGEANETCIEVQKLVKVKLERENTSQAIKDCVGLFKGYQDGYLRKEFVFSDAFCVKVLQDANKGFHGKDIETLVKENEKLKQILKETVDFRK